MKEVSENETYTIGSGGLVLDAELGNGHLGSIGVKLNNVQVAYKNNAPVEGLSLGDKEGIITGGAKLRVTAYSNKATPAENGILTIKLKDDTNTTTPPFEYDIPFDGETSIEFKIKFTLS